MIGKNKTNIEKGFDHSRAILSSRVFLLLLLSALLIVACGGGSPDEAAPMPSTGFSVVPEFAAHYDRYGPRLLGEPITGLCEGADGRIVQYFQRMRLELNGGPEVNVYPLGEWAYGGVLQEKPVAERDYSRQRHFPETGYAVHDEFLAFYEAHHGETILGPPISSQLDEGELRVQYFQNGRLEWHPNAPREERVQIGVLGQAHYAQAAQDVTCEFRARPVEVSAAQEVVVKASVSAPILYEGSEQRAFVDVTTPAGVPVSNVPVRLTVDDGVRTYTINLGRTDAEGKIQGPVQLEHFEPGNKITVNVNAYAVDNNSIGTTALSFQTWW